MSLTLMKNTDLQDMAVLDSSELALTIYLPIRAADFDVNRIRLKNLLSETKALLEERLDDNRMVQKVMQQLEGLSEHEAFNKARYPGLALLWSLADPEDIAVVPLWTQPEARVSVGREPFVSPLIRDSGHQLVTLLCLADNGLRLFRGRLGQLKEETPPEAFPDSLADVIRWELQAGLDGNEHYRNRTVGPGRSGRAGTHVPAPGATHGEGPASKVTGEFERRYFREIGKAMEDYLQEGEMLFLAGVHEKLALFREENDQLPVLEAELNGNFEGIEAGQLIEKANDTLARVAKDRAVSELKEAQELSPQGRSSDAQELSEAAAQSRVGTLFIKDDDGLSQHEKLALKVMQKGGRVVILDAPHWQDSLLGVYRW